MSADNFLGIYKVNNRKFIGLSCSRECEQDKCSTCANRPVFTAKSVNEAIKLAQEVCNDINQMYEYGYKFLNL